jgi:tetratricopeptide (TPR) repeat protein
MNVKEINCELLIKNKDEAELLKIKICLEHDFEATIKWLFYKKNKVFKGKCFTQFQMFWNSELPILFAPQLFSSNYKNELLMHYYFNQFYLDENNAVRRCSTDVGNISVLCKISEIIPNELMAFIKTGQHFLNDDCFNSFGFFRYSPNAELQMFYKVCEAFRKIHQQEERARAKYDKLIIETSIEDLLIHFSFYIEKIKWEFEYKYSLYRTNKIQFLSQVMNLILERKVAKKSNIEAKYKTVSAFDESSLKILLDKIDNPKRYEKFERLFAFYHNAWVAQSNYLNTFCFDKNYHTFIRKDNTLELSPKDINHHHNWLKNGRKYPYMLEYYNVKALKYVMDIEELLKKEINFSGDTEKHLQMNKNALLKACSELFMLEAYSVLDSIKTFSGQMINPYWLVYYITYFGINLKYRFTDEVESVFYKTKQHYLKCMLAVMKEQLYKFKRKVSFIRVNTLEELRETLVNMQSGENQSTFHYKVKKNATKESIEAALDFYIFDLNNIKNYGDIDLQTQPILKIGDLCYSIPSILGDTNIASLVLNKLLSKNNRTAERNRETEQISKTLAKSFEQREFLSAAEIVIKNKQGRIITDIDCAAYKDGVLFLIELKSTYLRSNLKEILDNENAMNKAGEQLQKVESYVKKNFQVIRSKLGMDRNIQLEDVRLYPLIVSTSFEQDYEYFNGYRKISLFELNIILNDEKNYLFSTATHKLKLIKKYYPDFDANRLTKTTDTKDIELEQILTTVLKKVTSFDNSFYPVGDTCSPKYIIEAIEQDKVWDFLDDDEYPIYAKLKDIIALDDSPKIKEHNDIYLKAHDAQYKENNIIKSMKLVEQALQLYPNHDEYLILRGDNYARLGKINKSIADLKKATEINPQNETAHCNLALSYSQIGYLQKALEHINKSVALNRSNQYALEKRGMIKGLLGLPLTSIIHDLKRVIAINPNNSFGKEAKITLDKIKII